MHLSAFHTTRTSRIRVAARGIGLATIVGFLTASCEEPAPPPPPPPEVYVTDVVQRDVPVYLELVGQTEGFQDVDIRARVEGFLETVNFQEGAFVRQGDILYRIDRKPLESTVAGLQSNLTALQSLQILSPISSSTRAIGT